ncbi:MAG TPA: monovalent cation/H+ antiporter subunit D family protein [Xanthomonadaceae bacterium]|nr:monovalent cation/H+ antiporter subunit D family protein [Xanthomonadaceae bacterium]
MIAQQLPILIVLAPLLAAPLCLILRGYRWPWLLATLAVWSSLASASALLRRVLAEGTQSYLLGGWEAPWGIELRVDAANGLILVLITAMASLVLPYARLSLAREIPDRHAPMAYASVLLLITGLCGMTVTADAFNVFVFLEISSLATYTLIALGRDRRALTASFQYLIMGTIGATFYLIGVGFLYAMTGTLNMADLAQRLPDLAGTGTVRVAFAFIVTGICLKLALFPLHLWLPNAYTFAPSAVSAMLAATATKVAVYLLIRFLLTVFGPGFSFGALPVMEILVPLAVVGMLSTSLVAIGQREVKRMLAYSSVAQIGYMVLGIGMASVVGVSAALMHMFNHALMKGALFMALGAIAYRVGGTSMALMRGTARTMPWTFWAFVIGGLSLVGVPGTAGFVSKWYLILGAIELGWWPVVAAIVVASLMALIYIGRVIEAGWFGESGHEKAREAPLGLLVPTWLLVAANLWFGIDTRLTVDVAGRAAVQLLGAAP